MLKFKKKIWRSCFVIDKDCNDQMAKPAVNILKITFFLSTIDYSYSLKAINQSHVYLIAN